LPSTGTCPASAIAASSGVGHEAPRLAAPIHWWTLASPRVWGPALPAREFARGVAFHASGVTARILAPGETLTLDGRGKARAGLAPPASDLTAVLAGHARAELQHRRVRRELARDQRLAPAEVRGEPDRPRRREPEELGDGRAVGGRDLGASGPSRTSSTPR
jgi:hypothetical protein